VSYHEIDLHIVTYSEEVDSESIIARDNMHLHLLPKHRFGKVSRYHSYLKDFERCIHDIRPDIVHAQSAFVEGYVTVRSNYPSVITFHGMIGEDAKYKTRLSDRLRLTFLSLTTERFCVRHARNSILISPYVGEYYGKKLRGDARFIPNPVNEAFFELERSEEQNRLLFAGKIIPRKGILDLIRACHIVTNRDYDCRLILAGSLEDAHYVAEVKCLIRKLGLCNHVSLTGLLSEQSILQEFRSASVLVLPSYQETAPMVIQQAMAAGIPVIATRICGIPYQVVNGTTGLLYTPHDVHALAEHITTVLKNDDLRLRMGAEGKRKADTEYRAAIVAEKTVKFYQEIVNGPAREL